MTQTFNIEGMTCQNCVGSIEKALTSLPQISEVIVDLEANSISLQSSDTISVDRINSILPSKYKVSQEQKSDLSLSSVSETSKWVQLRPLFLVLLYIIVASVLINYKNGDPSSFMKTYMGLFFIVFSFFKILDLKGFANSFGMYDPMANKINLYGIIYPFLEISLGLMFLMNWQIKWALILTFVILGTTTIGIIKTLMSKKRIKCACLGTTLNLPMTEATFIENAIMIVMSLSMILM